MTWPGRGYKGMDTLVQAIERAGSAMPADVAKALEGGTFDTIFGTATIQAQDHQMVLSNYFGRVVEVDGKPRNVISVSLTTGQEATPPCNPARKRGKT